MRIIPVLLLMVAMTTALARTFDGRRRKRELLLRSKRRWVLSTIEIVEEDPGPFPKQATQMFNDVKDSHNHKFRISGTGVTEEPTGFFQINEDTGVVYALKPINREEYDFFHIKFDILDQETGKQVDRTLAFDVEIKDINDNAPYFGKKVMTGRVSENSPEGYLPVQIQCWDLDQAGHVNSNITIGVISQEPKEPKFGVKMMMDGISNSGQLTFKGCLDYDKAKMYRILVEAKDGGTPQLSATATINLHVLDSNSHQPTFKIREPQGEVLENEVNKEVLRVSVEDKDTPNTPGWRAKYYFIKGNEEGQYKIETDPKTNEGVVTIIKGNNYERTTLNLLQIGVENEEPIFVCQAKPAKGPGAAAPPPAPDSVNITIKVIDVNDPPVFAKKVADTYQKEEESPGRVLYAPKVTDVDSELIRYELLEDPAGWVTIDNQTGRVTTVKKMDRESPFVNHTTNTYTVKMIAIDDGEPPATSTGTILIHLGDINDNLPQLVVQEVILCVNKGNKVMVPVDDADAAPYRGPFTFALGGEDKSLKKRWKLDPATGNAGGLVSLETDLNYGNYTVPLVIQDQQGMIGEDTAVMVVACDCGDGDVCRGKLPATANFGAPGIGALITGLLLFLLLLLVFFCVCGEHFKHIPIVEDEGNQTLIKYNEEGGGSACKSDPSLLLSRTNSVIVTDGVKQVSAMPSVMLQDTQNYQSAGRPLAMAQDTQIYKSSGRMMNTEMTSMGINGYQQRMSGRNDTMRSQGGQSMYSGWTTNRMNTYQNGSLRYSTRHSTRLSGQHIEDHLNRRLNEIEGDHETYPDYQPHEYAYEGEGSSCQSLDKLSLSNLGDEVDFLNDLGPKFKHLAGICAENQGKAHPAIYS